MRERKLEAYITEPTASNLIGVPVETLEGWRRRNIAGPPYVLMGDTIRYPMSLLIQWHEGETVSAPWTH